jgi:hypothetical protein
VGSELAEQHAAGLGDLRGDLAVGRGNVIHTQFGMAGRADAAGIVNVLECVGNAVKRPAIDVGLQFRVGAARVSQRAIPRQQNEGMEAGIARGDSGQGIVRQLL